MVALLPSENLPIVAMTDAYRKRTSIAPDQVLGRGIFEVFPDDAKDPLANGVECLRASLVRVVTQRIPDAMPLQRYSFESAVDTFSLNYWNFSASRGRLRG
ncbi:MAG: hypothetical protein H7249_05305 [Chitinophagaceae bacterium]|nr:hypothetical protein [Oligoflexus sp.]